MTIAAWPSGPDSVAGDALSSIADICTDLWRKSQAEKPAPRLYDEAMEHYSDGADLKRVMHSWPCF